MLAQLVLIVFVDVLVIEKSIHSVGQGYNSRSKINYKGLHVRPSFLMLR